MVSNVRPVYPNIEDVNPIASRMFAAVLKCSLDGQYYCSVLYCAICFSPGGSILCSLFHFAHGSGRVSLLGDIYPAYMTAALALCLKRNKTGCVGRVKHCWCVRLTILAAEREQLIYCFIFELNTSLSTVLCTESVPLKCSNEFSLLVMSSYTFPCQQNKKS